MRGDFHGNGGGEDNPFFDRTGAATFGGEAASFNKQMKLRRTASGYQIIIPIAKNHLTMERPVATVTLMVKWNFYV